MKLKHILGLVIRLATPETAAAVKAVLSSLARLGHLKGEAGQDVTPEQLSAMWEEGRREFRTLGDEARASNAALAAGDPSEP